MYLIASTTKKSQARRPASRTVVGKLAAMSVGCTPPRSAWAIRASSGPVGATGSGSSSWGMEAVLPLPTVMDAMICATFPSRMADDISRCFSNNPTSYSVRPAMLTARASS